MSLALVNLSERHLPEILAIERASQTAPWSEESFRKELTHPISIFLVAEDKAGVAGYGCAWVVVDEAHIVTVAISPERRRGGIGRQIVQRLMAEAQSRGATCATLEVRATNEAALRLYESMGFVRSGIRKHYYPDNGEDAVVMWLYGLATWAG